MPFLFSGQFRSDTYFTRFGMKIKLKVKPLSLANSHIFYDPHKNRHYFARSQEYLQFLVRDLKPFIDASYRTQPERENTFLWRSRLHVSMAFLFDVSAL